MSTTAPGVPDALAPAAVLDHALRRVVDHLATVAEGPVGPRVEVGELIDRVDALDLDHGHDPTRAVDLLADLLRDGTLHTTHPGYLGLFNPNPVPAAIAGSVLAAGYNPQLAVHAHAPAAVELERRLLDEVGGWLGLGAGPEGAVAGAFTSGGSEANAMAVAVALQRAHPEVADHGIRALPGAPRLYASAESHLAWIKIAHQAGLGRGAVRLVPVDDRCRLDVGALEAMLTADRAAGDVPVLLVGTAGTTGGGIVDPLPELADLASRHDLALHVDAAWAGAAAASPRLRPGLTGIERATSVTVDAHKWLSVPMGAGMFLTTEQGALRDAYRVATTYMPDATPGVADDPYTVSPQWSRRAIGVALAAALLVHGRSGIAARLERDVALGEQLRERLTDDGWRPVTDTWLPVVCVTDPSAERDLAWHRRVASHVVATGRSWISPVTVAGRPAVRLCVINHRTEVADLDRVADALASARGDLA